MKELILFTTEDCVACEKIKPLLLEVASSHGIQIKEIDPTEEIELAQKYGVSTLPTMVYNDTVYFGSWNKFELNIIMLGNTGAGT